MDLTLCGVLFDRRIPPRACHVQIVSVDEPAHKRSSALFPMGAEYIEFSHAKNGLESHPYDYRSSQNLVEVVDAERLRHNAAADLRTTEWKPGVKEWLVLTCVSLLTTMDAFNATIVLPLVTVCMSGASLYKRLIT